MINGIVHKVFERVTALSRNEVLTAACGFTIKEKQAIAQRSQREYTKAEKNLQKLKQEVVRSLTGQSDFAPGLLNELIQEQEKQCTEMEIAYTAARREVEDSQTLMNNLAVQYDQYLEWSMAYDTASIEARKMIVSHLIERVDVFSGYRLKVKFNISLEQFKLGLDISAYSGYRKSHQSGQGV